MTADGPHFSLVMGTLGRCDQLGRMLASLERQTHSDFELIIVDQNAPGFLDATLAPFAHLPIVRIASLKGLSRARNAGLRVAAGAIIAFPDDDCWYDPDTLATAAGLLRAHPDAAAVCGRTLDAAGAVSLSPTSDVPQRLTRANYMQCGNSNTIFVRRGLVDLVGDFDERLGVGAATRFQSGEESDLLLRALAAGLVLEYDPALIVHHDQVDARIGPDQLARSRKYAEGYGALLRKHRFGAVTLLKSAGRPAAGALVALAQGKGALARYRWRRARGIWSGYRRWGRG